jgi:hypothetical protein
VKIGCRSFLIEEDENVNGFIRIDRIEGGVAFLDRAF